MLPQQGGGVGQVGQGMGHPLHQGGELGVHGIVVRRLGLQEPHGVHGPGDDVGVVEGQAPRVQDGEGVAAVPDQLRFEALRAFKGQGQHPLGPAAVHGEPGRLPGVVPGLGLWAVLG